MFGGGALAASCFDAVRDLALRLPSASVEELDGSLGQLAGVRFVPAHKARPRRRPGRPLVAEDLYEVRIVSRREVPTRPGNLHDLCNALSWAAFPASKWQLTRRLAEEQRARVGGGAWKLPGVRTGWHDRLALLDEGGVLIAGDVSAVAGGAARALVFGHALLEHALTGRTAVSGAAVALPVDPVGSIEDLRRRLDGAFAAWLARDHGALVEEELPRIPLTEIAGKET